MRYEDKILGVLGDFTNFIEWDRFTEVPLSCEMQTNCFGWIRRTDGKRDFVLFQFYNGTLDQFHTSSAKYTVKIATKLGWIDRYGEKKHFDCEKIPILIRGVS